MMSTARGFVLCVYAIISCFVLCEGFIPERIMGGEGTDLWNSLWNVDFFWESLSAKELPIKTVRLNAPNGGSIWISDLVGAVTMGPLVSCFGWDWGYQIWLLCSCTLLGWCTHFFALDLGAKHGAWISGFGVMFSGVFLSSVHNGASEGIGLYLLVLALWMIWRSYKRDTRWFVALLCSFIGGLSSWYSAVMIGVFWCSMCVYTRSNRQRMLLVVWVLMLLPWAVLSIYLTTGEENLVGIKNIELMDQVRRTLGSSDLLSYVSPLSATSTSEIWRFGGDYLHSSYLGLTLCAVFLVMIRSIEKDWRFAGGFICLILSLGPVLVYRGAPVVFWERGIPLPYFLLEYLWGFNGLSLLYRFSFGVVLGVSLMVGQAVGNHRSSRTTGMVVILMMVEVVLWSSIHGVPKTTNFPSSKGFELLASKETGFVLNHPVVAGKMYLFEQVLHRKPIYDTINDPINKEGRDLWSLLEDKGCDGFGRDEPIYLVSHREIEHRPQREDRLVQKAIKECSVLYSDHKRIIVELK